MNIKMIGCGSIWSKTNSASFLVDDKILIDVPNGTFRGILKLGYNIDNLECICITHFHGDHFFDLPFVLLSLFSKRKGNNNNKLYIICDKTQRHKIKEIIDLSGFKDFQTFCNVLNLEVIGINEKENNFDLLKKYNIQNIPVKHTQSTYGYVIKDKNTNVKVGFTGDSMLCDGVEKIVNISDVCFCDMSDIISDNKSHMGIDSINYLLSKYKDKKIVSAHMKDETRDKALKIQNNNFIVGTDGLEINI